MPDLIIDYTFDQSEVSNPNGSERINLPNTEVVKGPGKTKIGKYPKALDFGKTGKGKVDLTGIKLNTNQFCFQFVIRISSEVKSRQNIFESNFLPFSISARPGKSAQNYILRSSIKTKDQDWNGPDTKFKKYLKLKQWYSCTVAYDHDTLVLFIDDDVISVHAFPNGEIVTGEGKELYIGTWVDGKRNQFYGSLAAFKWYNGISIHSESEPETIEDLLQNKQKNLPIRKDIFGSSSKKKFESHTKDILEIRIDEQRSRPEWFITYKFESFKKINKENNLGNRVKGIIQEAASGMFIQYYKKGAITYTPGLGVAFEMHGAIFSLYKKMNTHERRSLGILVSDEKHTIRWRGRENIFSGGGIFWSSQYGAIPVLKYIYLHYKGQNAKILGLPKKRAKKINTSGWMQEFEYGNIYSKNKLSQTFEVHGAILRKFKELGGIKKYGFPKSDLMKIRKENDEIGEFSEFESCTIYWSYKTEEAHEVHGVIRKEYLNTGYQPKDSDKKTSGVGPLSILGFPTSDEMDIPDYAGIGKINTFENGSILYFSDENRTVVTLPFKIHIGRIDSQGSDGWLKRLGYDRNELYMYYRIKGEGNEKKVRLPKEEGSYRDESNIYNPNHTIDLEIKPNKIDKEIKFWVQFYDKDFFSDDDLGEMTMKLNAKNAWGLKENPHIEEKFNKINSFKWSVKPQINTSNLSYMEKWWGFHNFDTPEVSKEAYASAFWNVSNEPHWYNLKDDFNTLYYNIIKGKIASSGNCFGMSLEAVYAKKGASLFNLPLDQYKEADKTTKYEMNIKQMYQAGAEPLRWFVGEFLTGGTHNPKYVFESTQRAHKKGLDPLICLCENYDLTGSKHAVLPVHWNKNGKDGKWEIKICDPNYQDEDDLQSLYVNPESNKFRYEPFTRDKKTGKKQKGSTTYQGSRWSGSRFYYISFSHLNRMPRTPVVEILTLLKTLGLGVAAIIVADDAETDEITDGNGKDLDATGKRAKKELQDKGRLSIEYFVPFYGFDNGSESEPNQILMRGEAEGFFQERSTSSKKRSHSYKPTEDQIDPQIINALKEKNIVNPRSYTNLFYNVLPEMTKANASDVVDLGKNIQESFERKNFIHHIKGKKDGGKMKHLLIYGLNYIQVETNLDKGEKIQLKVENLNNTSENLPPVIKITSDHYRVLKLNFHSKLGLSDDFINIEIEKITVQKDKPVEMSFRSGLAGLEIVHNEKYKKKNIPINIW